MKKNINPGLLSCVFLERLVQNLITLLFILPLSLPFLFQSNKTNTQNRYFFLIFVSDMDNQKDRDLCFYFLSVSLKQKEIVLLFDRLFISLKSVILRMSRLDVVTWEEQSQREDYDLTEDGSSNGPDSLLCSHIVYKVL